MTGIKGFQTTAGKNSSKPARRRFTDPKAVYDVYDEFRIDDEADAKRRVKIRTAYEGGLPYDAEQLKAKGLRHMTNLSFNALKNTIDARCESITKLTSDTCNLVTVAPKRNGAEGPDDARVGAIIAEAFSAAVRKDGHTIAALATARREVDLYGIGPVTWPNDEAFYPLALERGQVKFRGDGPSVSSDHDIFMFESELPAEYVFMLLDNEDIAKEAGWDVAVLKRVVVDVYSKHIDKSHDSSSEQGLSPDETFLSYTKMNSFYERHQFDKFSVLHVYCREMSAPRKVSHIIVPGSDVPTREFLFYKEGAYDTMDQCMLWLSATTGERYARSVRGIATYLVPIERVSDRMTCALIDAAFRAARLTLQQTSPGVQPDVSLSENGNVAVVAAGLEPVPNANQAANLQALASSRQFIAQLGTSSVAGTDNAPLSTGVKVQEGGVQASKAEAEIMERRRLLRDENLFNSCVGVHDKIFREIFRRFMNIVNGPEPVRDEYPVVNEFIAYCADHGVTAAMLKEAPGRFTVEMCRDLAMGADGMYQLLSATLQVTAGNLDESGRREVVHDMYRLKFGRAAADRYCPLVSRDSAPSDQASFATLENSFLRELKPVMVGPEQWHWSHIPVHAQVLQEVQEAVQQGLAEAQSAASQGADVQQSPDGELAPQVDEPERLAQVLEAASAHIQEHLQFGQTQLGMKEAAQQVRDMLKGLAPTIKALNLAIATQRRVREAEEERRQRELEELQKQASEAEMQKALAKVQADKEVGLAKVQADKEVGLAKVQVDREISAGKLQVERESASGRLGIETEAARAKAANDAAVARAGIENRRAESEAGIEAARRTQETREELARRDQRGRDAQHLMENYDRLSNVTGRNLTPPSVIASQAPGNMQEPMTDIMPA